MIRFDGVTVTYPGADRPVLAGVTCDIPEGDLCLVVGATGSGKSTLLGAIDGLVPHATGGTLRGAVVVDGRDTATHLPRDLADVVGYVGQDPLRGFVTDTVEDEIAYGMEQLGTSPVAMRKRVEETFDLLGIADLRRRPLAALSGGQQQRVAIAAVLAVQPRVLVLDEPTSQLDPTAAQDVLAALTGLVHDSGLTVVLAEHRLERVMQAADSVVWLPGDGRAVAGDPASVLTGADVTPPLVALARVLGWTEVPLSVREARRRVQREHIALAAPPPPAADGPATGRTADGAVLSARGIVVRYGELVAVDHVDLDLPGGSLTAVMGRNGAGKSSLLWALQGSLTCTGQLAVAGADPRRLSAAQARSLVVLVPQTAADLLYLPTVGDELAQADAESGAAAGTAAGRLTAMGFALDPRTDPRDLSEGQRLALVLAIQLAASPPVILLDEPTRGLDYAAKAALTDVLTGLAAAGAAVMVATHDVEFAAQTCPRMVLMAQGEIVASGPTAQLAASSPAYAPQLAKVFAPAPVLTARDVAAGLR